MLRSFPLLLLLPAMAFAQTPEVVQKIDAKLDAERAAQRNEDVEILRRLLNKAAGLPDKVSVTPPASDPFRIPPGWKEPAPVTSTSAAVGPFDGVYLAGAGVVFTLHVPAGAPTITHAERIGLNSSCGACHQDKNHAPAHAGAVSASLANCYACHTDVPKVESPLSDWDRTRLDVRGEKPKPADKPKGDQPKAAVCEPGNLQSLIAGVLAANGKNVRHLGEKEGVTVVVTFDEAKPVTVISAPNTEPIPRTEPLVSSNGEGPVVTQPTTKQGFTRDDAKALSLGDLHLKQGKYKEAVEAYAGVLGRFTDKEFKLSGLSQLTAKERNEYADRLQTGVRDAMKNYAKALLMADQPDKAKWALEMATGFVVLEVTPTTVPASSTAPAKLIVTVSKADIDAAKDAAAVKKAVKVSRQTCFRR